MRRAVDALSSAASRAAAGSRAASSSAPKTPGGASGDYRWAAGVPEHLLQREVRRRGGVGGWRPCGGAIGARAGGGRAGREGGRRRAGRGRRAAGRRGSGDPRGTRELGARPAPPFPPSSPPPPLQVVVFAPARTPSQQGMSQTASPMGKGGAWRIEFETKPK
jgi:hypothetical protein